METKTVDTRIFNTALDLGLRSLFILSQSRKRYDLQSLVYLDYFLVHSGDVSDGPSSLHPNSDFRSGELLVRRNLMKEGLNVMHQRQLLDVFLNKDGIYFSRNKLTPAFLNHYANSIYASELNERAKWVCAHFGSFSEEKLKKYVRQNIEKWGAEFLEQTDSKPRT